MKPFLVHQLLEQAADKHPGAVAVVDGDRTTTYADLEAAANRLAHLLVELGVRRGDRVGIYLEKSTESVVAVYGALKAGAAYVPLDPQAPPSRLAFIAANCGIRLLLTSTAKRPAWPELLAGGAPVEQFVVLDGGDDAGAGADGRLAPAGVLTPSALIGRPTEPPQVPQIGLDLAYILYTSGSTGEPKGVMLSHLNCMSFVDWAGDQFSVGPDDRLSNHAPLHFDLSTFDLFAAAAAGAAVVLVPPRTSIFPSEVARFIETQGVTVWYSVPSVLSMLAMRGNLPPGGRLGQLRTVLFAGEVFPTKYLRALMSKLPGVRFANLYGPTETNVCTWYDVPPLADDMTEPIPLGRAIAGVEVFAVTDDGRLAGMGEEGELWVRGPTVMQGYWADAERTARSLVPNPFGGQLHDPTYRTGDVVVLGADGDWRFLGRRDSQIKSRGYRIELGEVEAALYADPAVVECAVVALPDDMVSSRIKACLVVREGVTQADVARACATRLPRYMVPEVFELRPELPRTSTGKIDRQALGRPVDGS